MSDRYGGPRRALQGLALSLVFWLWASDGLALVSEWDAAGYVKDLFSHEDTGITDDAAATGEWQNTLQVRLNLNWYPAGAVAAGLGTRHLLVLQRNIGRWKGYVDEINPGAAYYFDLEAVAVGQDDILLSAVDRLWAELTHGGLVVTAGRQRIAWGTCLVWNPIDLFNPYSVLDFDYQEKPGTDAVRVQVYTGAVSTVEFAAGPGRTSRSTTYGARYLTGLWNYDISGCVGWEKELWRFGASWAGQIGGGGVRGEVLYSRPGATLFLEATSGQSPSTVGHAGEAVGDFWTLALSYDYTFRNSLYLLSEFLYNGLGTTGDAGPRLAETVLTGELSPARYSIFQEFAYDISPLVKADVFALVNPDDGSWACVSSLAYSISTAWELHLLALPSGGRSGTEFGDMPGQVAIRIRYDF